MTMAADFEQAIYRDNRSAPSVRDLFTSFAEDVLLRVDEVLANRNCKWTPSAHQRDLLYQLRPHQGADRAMPLGEICERMKLTPRAVKDLVQDLRQNFVGAICASRDGENGGYFLAASFAEVQAATLPMRRQAVTMLRVAKAMEGPQHDIEEMLGQIRLELQKEGA